MRYKVMRVITASLRNGSVAGTSGFFEAENERIFPHFSHSHPDTMRASQLAFSCRERSRRLLSLFSRGINMDLREIKK
jgi:hypothetical protein